jgi:hypothetical protein
MDGVARFGINLFVDGVVERVRLVKRIYYIIGDMDRVKHEVQVKVRRETRLSSATAARKVK